MRIGLFIPCYVDAFFPEVGIATLELLERLGHEVAYPRDQTCCGQPMANSGFNADCAATEALFVRNFAGFDYVVAPSGSCVHHVRDNFDAIEQTAQVKDVRARTYELVEFLHDVLKIDASRSISTDECCGFGGTFSVFEEVVSTEMGYDKVRDHAHAGAEYIVSADTSCLMHQQGCAERIGVLVKFIHIVQILNGAAA